MEAFEIEEIFSVKPSVLYKAWLDSKIHAEMTGSPADIDAKKGGKFTAWDGYISGKTIELEPNKKIVQEWRTTEFPAKSPNSILELDFEEKGKGTRLVLKHSKIPQGQGEEYKQGWIEYYFEPMKKKFS